MPSRAVTSGAPRAPRASGAPRAMERGPRPAVARNESGDHAATRAHSLSYRPMATGSRGTSGATRRRRRTT
eukprot:2970887-Lingulodinium_polyedra.AAC.1